MYRSAMSPLVTRVSVHSHRRPRGDAREEAQMTIDRLRWEFTDLLGTDGVISEGPQLRTYECDGLTGYRVRPALVVLPTTTEQVAAVVRACRREQVPFVARGAGAGLS